MAQIKHIAIRTRDVDKTALFYKEAFGLQQVGLGQNGVYLTDGHLNIAILKYQKRKDGEPLRLGIDHVGFKSKMFLAASLISRFWAEIID
jgi:catechol 2,3-dioxygenase-like lactoylglutathione lyase family enzyme